MFQGPRPCVFDRYTIPVMDPLGIEPRFSGRKPDVLPLDYGSFL